MHEDVVEAIRVDNEAASRDDGLAWCHKSRSLASTQKPMMTKVVEAREDVGEVAADATMVSK